MTHRGPRTTELPVQAGGDKLQAQSEQKLAEMAGNHDLRRDADAAKDADHRADTAGS